jgi:hypothetical protein
VRDWQDYGGMARIADARLTARTERLPNGIFDGRS